MWLRQCLAGSSRKDQRRMFEEFIQSVRARRLVSQMQRFEIDEASPQPQRVNGRANGVRRENGSTW